MKQPGGSDMPTCYSLFMSSDGIDGKAAGGSRAAVPLVLCQNVVRSFVEGAIQRPVLRNLDLEVAEGECLALLGQSGSGKSTLLNLLAGIDTPDAGAITIAGQPIHALDERRRTLFRRRNIGFVYQLFNLIPTLSVDENIALHLELIGLPEPEIGRRVAGMLERVGLGGRQKAFPDQLSGGEQQRVAVARAVIHEPMLLLADEPTGNLDAVTGRQILELLTDLARRRGHTLILVTHSRAVSQAADRVVALRDGRILPAGETLAW